MFYLPQLFKTQEEISAVKKQLKKEEMALGRHKEKLVTGGGGGYLTKFCMGRLCPEVQPLTLSYTILAE